jgi:hypothetical protein
MTETIPRPSPSTASERSVECLPAAGGPPARDIGAALRALYAPVAERALPIYYGPVLGRLFLRERRPPNRG